MEKARLQDEALEACMWWLQWVGEADRDTFAFNFCVEVAAFVGRSNPAVVEIGTDECGPIGLLSRIVQGLEAQFPVVTKMVLRDGSVEVFGLG